MSNKSCDLIQSGVAGPSTERIMDSIRTEFWLPPNRGADAQPDRTSTTETKKVKP
jgi:hypothetical protein